MDESEDIPTLVIRFDPASNQVTVEGPIKNRLLAYGMLKMGEKAIDEDYAKDQARVTPVEVANGQRFLKRY